MSATVRLSALYGGIFFAIGIMMPFWPVWLQSRGLSATEIGLTIACGSLVRVFLAPQIARFADRTGERRRPIICLAIAAFVFYLPFYVADEFWMILLLQACAAGTFGPLMPMSESLTMTGARSQPLNYGRIRLWGSLTFIAGASGIGFFLKGADPDAIWASISVALALVVLITLFIPDFRSKPAAPESRPFRQVIQDKTFLLFIMATVCVQGSHALYYSFGTLNWLRMGLEEGVIGLLWAEGVVAEVILFVFAADAIRKIGPARLIALGGLACLIRWGLTAYTDALAVIVLLQLLHAFTFGAAHLGAIYFIADRMPEDVSATAQTVYALVVSGLGVGLMSFVSGHLYDAYQGHAYLAMAVLGGTGMIIAWRIRRRQ
ncbi:MAG: 3-phenylpropionate MFS transporter [Rhodospirillales bacterium]|nr:3-phenylpropionate MFS transporter [Rhodospirillales bacterium]